MHTHLIENTCLTVTLRAGAQLLCREGTLWLTMESHRPRRSPDIVLTSGERYCVAEDGDYFLSAPGKRSALCQIDRSCERQRHLLDWLKAPAHARLMS